MRAMSRKRQRNQSELENQPLQTAIIESLDQEGRGVTHVGGKTIFVEGALPTEKVLFRSTRVKTTYEVAETVEILKSSNQRVSPHCKHFGLCGGCKLQHLDFAAQVAAKQRLLENDLKHIGQVTPENILPPLYGQIWGYRHKARLSVKYVAKKQRVLVGFNEKSTRFVADMDSCQILVPQVSDLIVPLQSLILQLSIRDQLPQIELAVGEPSPQAPDWPVIVLIFRIMAALTSQDEQLIKAFAEQHNVQIWLQTKGPDTIKPFWPTQEEIQVQNAQLQYRLPEFNLRYPFKPNEFTQVNPKINQMMIRRAMQLLQPQSHEWVIDFFCGIGNFTLPVARSGAKVIGIEGLANLVERANESAVLNDIHHASFKVADLFKMDDASLTRLGKADKWLIDPPRDGAFELVKAITQANCPKRIVYVSCNPATLARDAGVLVNEKGYILKAAGVMNMFPHTAHVESIALFEYTESV